MQDRFSGKAQFENYNFNTTDFRSILTKLSHNNYIVVLGWEETGNIVRQARELGIESQIIGIDTFASQDFRDNTHNSYDGLKFTFWQGAEGNPMFTEMLSNYKTKYGQDPENVLFVATGYDAMLTLGEAMKNCDSDIDCSANYLRNNIHDFSGATGSITIDPDGITRSIQESIHYYDEDDIKKLN